MALISNYKVHIMFMAGNKLLKDKNSCTQRSVTKCKVSSQAKNSLRSAFLLAVKSNNFLLYVMLQLEVFPQVEGRNLKKVTISKSLPPLMKSTAYLPFINVLKSFVALRVVLLQFAIIHIWCSEVFTIKCPKV